jgi:L-ascorbate metabolism protein UlaG (beta-lactamase superfamily)
MIITYHGKQFFKLQVGDTVFALNPIGKDSKTKDKVAKFGADAVLSTTQHADFNGFENVTYGEKEPFIVDGPGSYEIEDNFIQGLETKTLVDSKEYINTMYYFTFDGMRVLFLGALTSKEIPAAAQEIIEEVDIIFVPIGDGFLMPAEAHKLAVSFSPSVIIPMSYDQKTLDLFIKEGGDASVKAESKLTLKLRDLENFKSQIMPLSV